MKKKYIKRINEAISWYGKEYGAMFVNHENLRAERDKLRAEVAQLKAQGSGQWVPVEDGITGDADGGMMLTVSDNGQSIMLRDDSPGCKEFDMADLRICRKVEGERVPLESAAEWMMAHSVHVPTIRGL